MSLPRVTACFPLCLLLMIAVAAFAPPARAQDQLPAQADDEVIRVDTNLVTLPVIVTDKQNRRIANLSRTDFAVEIDNRPVNIEYFSLSSRRVALLYTLDASGSSRDTIVQQREAALTLFSKFGRGSQIAVVHFREKPELALPFSQDAADARAAFRVAALPNRRTAVFDAAVFAARAFDDLAADQTVRRIVVLLTDGLDTASAAGAAAAISEARTRGVSFYVIHLPLFVPGDGRLVPRPPSRGVRDLAQQTGGRFFSVGDAETALNPRAELDLGPVLQAVAEDLQSQYIIGFYDADKKMARGSGAVRVRLLPPKDRQLRVNVLR